LNGSDEQLMENVMAVLEHLNRLGGRQPDQQGQGQQQQQQVSKYIQRVYLSTRAHPGIQIIC
jgi:ribosomal protein L1